MIYTAGSPEDEAQHIQHHERFLEALRYVVRAGAAAQVGQRGSCRQIFCHVLSPKSELSVRAMCSSSKRSDGCDLALFLHAEVAQLTAESLPLSPNR